MPTRWDTLIVLSQTVSASELMEKIRQRFNALGVQISPNSMVIFNDFGNVEREPECASSGEDAIARVLSWPGLGGLEYELLDYPLSVFLLGKKAGNVDAVSLSVLSSAYMEEQLQDVLDQLVEDLHRTLNAKRTISAGNLLSPGSRWAEELERVRQGIFEGQYKIDLR